MKLWLLTKDQLYELALKQQITMEMAADNIKRVAEALTHDGQKLILEHTSDMLKERSEAL